MSNPWEAKTPWVWTPQWSAENNATPTIVYFRKELELTEKPMEAVIQISADSRYRLYINEQPICVGPCKGDGFVWHYEELDVASYLQKGSNVIAIKVLRYPTEHKKGNDSVWRTSMPGLYLTGNIKLTTGETIPLQADESFSTIIGKDVTIVSESGLMTYLWINEHVDASKADWDWMRPGFENPKWESAVPYISLVVQQGVSPAALKKRPIPMMYEKEQNYSGVMCARNTSVGTGAWENMLSGTNSLCIPANSIEVVELNAGELMTGYLQWKLLGGVGASMKILTSECYAYPNNNWDNPMDNNPIKKDRMDYVNGQLFGLTDLYRVGGYGTDEHPESYDTFWFRTFRFVRVEISTSDVPLTIQSFNYRETGYPLEVKTQVTTSDASLSDIWDISLRSLRRCMQETYVDCPFYEQLQYVMDTRAQILFTYQVAGDDRMARKCIDEIHRSLRPDGMVNCCYPSFGPNIIPGFSLFYIMILHDFMMYRGDKSFLKTYLSTIDSILNFFDTRIDEHGLVGHTGGPIGTGAYWSFIDWTPQWNETVGVPTACKVGPITMESLLYIMALDAATEIMEYEGRPGIAEEYATRSASVKKAIQTYCKGANGYYQDGPGIEEYSQHCQVFATLTGLVEGDECHALMERALTDESLAGCSVAMTYYLFRAVEKANLYEHMEALWNPWRKMISDHLTTCVENETSGRSDCHAWGATALYELSAITLGVRPAAPGYASIRVQPISGYLTFAKGDVTTPYGMVHVEWTKEPGEKMQVMIDVPEGTVIVE